MRRPRPTPRCTPPTWTPPWPRCAPGRAGKDGEDPAALRTEMQQAMDQYVGIYRNEADLLEGLKRIRAIKARFPQYASSIKSKVYNLNLS